MNRLFDLWSFKTPRYHFKWQLESEEESETFTSILTVKDNKNVEIYRQYEYGGRFSEPTNVDTSKNQNASFYSMVREAITFIRSTRK